jgi:hypothetical protein
MNWLTHFCFWAWSRLLLGVRESQVLHRAIEIARRENDVSGALGYDPRTKHLLSYLNVRKQLGNPQILTGAVVHVAVAVAYLESKKQSERIF